MKAMLPTGGVAFSVSQPFDAMPDDVKTKLIGFHAEPELANAVKEAARRQERTVSEYMRRTLRRQLQIESRIFGDSSTRSSTAAAS